MTKKKKPLKTRLRQRLSYLNQWRKRPVLIASIFLGTALFVAVLFLASPCGKGGFPERGFCGSVPITTGLTTAIIAIASGFLIALAVIFHEPPDKATVRKIFQRSNKPSWWRKWQPRVFAIWCIIVAAGIVAMDVNAGLRWYHYLAQIFITPFVVWAFTDSTMEAIRKRRKGANLR